MNKAKVDKIKLEIYDILEKISYWELRIQELVRAKNQKLLELERAKNEPDSDATRVQPDQGTGQPSTEHDKG